MMRALFVFLFVIFFSATAFAENPVIKLTILDTPNLPQKSLWSEYQNSFIEGIETASKDARNKGYSIEYKTFFYGTGPLDILDQIPKLKKYLLFGSFLSAGGTITQSLIQKDQTSVILL